MTWLRLVCRGAVATALASGDVMRMRMARTPLFHDRVMLMPSMTRVSVLMVVGIEGMLEVGFRRVRGRGVASAHSRACECAVSASRVRTHF